MEALLTDSDLDNFRVTVCKIHFFHRNNECWDFYYRGDISKVLQNQNDLPLFFQKSVFT